MLAKYKHFRVVLPLIIIIILIICCSKFFFQPLFYKIIDDAELKSLRASAMVGYSLVNSCYFMGESGTFTVDKAKGCALTSLGLGMGEIPQTHTVWIVSNDYRLLYHSRSEEHLNKEIMDLIDANGRFIVKEIVELAKKDEEGQYDYSLLNELLMPEERVTVVKYFPMWGWTIVSEMNKSDYQGNTHAVAQKIQSVFTIVLIFIFAILSGWVVIALIKERERMHLKKMVATANSQLEHANHSLKEEIFLRKQFEESAKNSDFRFRAIFEQSYQFIGLLDVDGNLLDANKTAINFINVKKSEVLGKRFWETPWWSHSVAVQDQLIELFEECKTEKKTTRGITKHLSYSGREVLIDFSLSPIIDEQGRLLYIIPEGRDVTDFEQAKREALSGKGELDALVKIRTLELSDKNKELEKTVSELQEAHRQLIAKEKLSYFGMLIEGVAHEIKNPLNFINNSAEMIAVVRVELLRILTPHFDKMKNDLPELNEYFTDLEDATDLIKKHGERSDRIVKTMLIQSRDPDRVLVKANISTIVEETFNLVYRSYIAKNPIDIIYNLQVEEVLPFKMYKYDIEHAFVTIFENAINFMQVKKDKLGVGYTPKLIVNLNQFDDLVIISIRDNGVGIPKENLDKIFEPFFSTKMQNGGVGIGLCVARDLFGKHNGTIEVMSDVDKYTEFVIKLPIPQS